MAAAQNAGTNSITKVLESICRERRREHLDKESEEGFIVLAIESFWTRLFSQYFVCNDDETRDDLLFYVKGKNTNKDGKVEKEQAESKIAVFRKDSKVLPSLGDPSIDWEESVYLNLILHQFEYTLTCAICTKPQEKEMRVLSRISQKVYASPNRRRMDSKGISAEISYPNIFFILDNFEETFRDFSLQENEMVCVELVAKDKTESVEGVIFLGSIRYESLKKVYDGRASVASKVARKVSMGWWRGPANVEFIKMKGPAGKGHAEMAITQHRGLEERSSLEDSENSDWRTCSDCGEKTSSSLTNHQVPIQDEKCSCGVQSKYGEYPKWTAGLDGSNYSETSSDKKKKGLLSPSQHWMKFRKKNLSPLALSAYLTYVTLPWNKIMKDILEVRQPSILT
ncbi:uncharacterized protein KIAA0930 homolog isoform X2 [Orbicella faveolata]|uniref:uncharacterized protein KIAA0930 homolog isoform X1 n=1 Tax=Orbicella faveolata TaxID=48498 RepID=UPI0009E2B486|nr:uncharacterized protein KIAA0930 homolog isoform X1 [Orbicella faveolata]XP_020625184.1 uncharacterized protein KIAA0930 homolog isoform X2 [Orbicella faveolata]